MHYRSRDVFRVGCFWHPSSRTNSNVRYSWILEIIFLSYPYGAFTLYGTEFQTDFRFESEDVTRPLHISLMFP